MADSSTDRNLLFGLLALQMDFITRDALITAMNTCAEEKDKPLGQVLQSQGALAEDDDGLLDSLVCRFMEKHDNNARRSLAAVTTVTAIRHDLEKIGDHDLSVTLDYVANVRRRDRTGSGHHDPSCRRSGKSRGSPFPTPASSTPEAASVRSGSPGQRTQSGSGTEADSGTSGRRSPDARPASFTKPR